jgi:UDP-N-acetylglucosamine diphosphorylase / glucose-1-phosphate thymidylyltransferase / UDP-N-acetylgalactosamine diphosphorylase / glucosamine-1-phosphate N-acetyltransferase / galactosamine-1-phosphate N-acetyltransferase
MGSTMDITKVRDWFAEHSLIKDFEEGVEVQGFSEEKWAFYFQVQGALSSLPRYISPSAKVSQSAEIVGQVVIEAGAQILPGVFIEGPVYIGRDVMVGNNALIRGGSFLSRSSIIGNHCYSTEAIFGPGAGAFHFCGISRSLLEKNSRLSAFVVTATTRPDLQPITSHIPNKFECKMTLKRGTIIGENTFIGAHVAIPPGISIEKNCCIGPYAFVQSDLQAGKMLKVKLDVEISENQLTVAEIPRAPLVNFSRQFSL